MTWKCNVCGMKFATEARAVAHVEKRHANDALWVEGNKTLWRADSEQDGYEVVCETHSTVAWFATKAVAMDWCRNASTDEFCDACRDNSRWCLECGGMIETYAKDLAQHNEWKADARRDVQVSDSGREVRIVSSKAGA